MSSNSLTGKVALVTGGAKGYGAGIAAELRRAGATVYITGRDQTALDTAAQTLGVTALAADVTSAADWERVVATITQASGRLDILINNAGAGVKIAEVTEQSVESIQDVIAINLTGPILGARAVVPIMKTQGAGTVINISSICERESWPGWSVYAASKAGLKQFSEGLYVENRVHGIRVTTLTPSWGRTEFLKNAALDAFDAETAEKVTQPAELGQIVVNLCAQPAHLCTLEMTILPLVQEIVPL